MYYMNKEAITVRVDPEVRGALDSLAAALDRDRSYVINEALAAYIETHRWQIEHIRQGLREAEGGNFVDAREVQKVVNRLRRK
jgi:predicted transcriptional regulator